MLCERSSYRKKKAPNGLPPRDALPYSRPIQSAGVQTCASSPRTSPSGYQRQHSAIGRSSGICIDTVVTGKWSYNNVCIAAV